MVEEVKEEKGKKKGAIVLLVVLAAVVAVAVIAYSALPGIRASMPYQLTAVDEADPVAKVALAGCTIKDSGGETLALGDIAAKSRKPVVMNVWATWCPHCVEEMNDYQKLFDEYGDRIDFVMLNLNDTAGEPEAARAYVQEHGYTFPVYYDVDSSVCNALAITGIPVSAVLSADGDLLLFRSGTINYQAMKGTIENLLNS